VFLGSVALWAIVSKLCDQVLAVLKEVFPFIRVKTEEFVSFRNQRLFIDIFAAQLDLVIEVHGRQHDNFVEHFHGSAEAFKASRRRDRLKEEWAAEEGLTFVVLREKDLPITAEKLLEAIDEASHSA